MGCPLLNLLPQSAIVSPKPKRPLFPVLVLLFLFSYGLMTMLIVEQGKTIDVQRYLIGQLFGDSAKLSHLQGEIQQQRQAKAQAETQAPPFKAAPPAKPERKRHVTPLRPPKDTSDSSDARRSLTTI